MTTGKRNESEGGIFPSLPGWSGFWHQASGFQRLLSISDIVFIFFFLALL